jgi:hypothetical protein
MTLPHNPGRVAGFWYLLLVMIGPLRLIYIPSKLFVPGNATATVNNIAAHELLFRLGIAGDLAGAVILIFLTLAFYRLFAGVDRNLAVLVVIFGGVMPALIDIRWCGERLWRPDGRARRRFLICIRQTSAGRPGHAVSQAARPSKHRRRDPLGSVAPPVSPACVQIALSAAVSGRVAGARRLRLPRLEPCRRAVATISGQGVYDFPACLLRRDSAHAVAGDQGRQVASARRRSLIGGWLGCLTD